ncbi:asparagine synthase (glutamine-hydrolyzing) [Nocardia camponoti]|nr:asparagine synthase (glutamine-hydrolyzing) [Nocardia camponoti]
MCGITGWVSFSDDLGTLGNEISAMTNTLDCRGPDGSGTYVDKHVVLGHSRLAIIDLDGGAQPMSAEVTGGRVTLVYSGEVYNFQELRAELALLGHKFVSRSDTEVVLRGYIEWGAKVADRLNGMYGFAIWDSRDSKLLMIRDRAGVKPFYYYPTSDGVVFGSEPKAIFANPRASRKLTVDSFRELFSYIKSPGHAIWDGMLEVEPGTIVTVDVSGIRTARYWSLETTEHQDDLKTTVATVRELLHDIIVRQQVSDVPTCTLLSGGLDSSTITSIAAFHLASAGEKVRSFSVDFVGLTENFVADELRGTPDTPFAHDVVRKWGTEHQDIVLSSAAMTAPSVRHAAIAARDFPSLLGDLDLSLYLFFQELRKHATVTLTGESADELFGGYRQFFDPAARQGTTFPWLSNGHQFFGRGNADLRNQSLLARSFEQSLDLPSYIQDSYSDAVRRIDRLPAESDFEWQMRKINYLHLTRFVRIWLDRKDRISMAHGLEVRVPFSDHRLVEYVYNTPWAMKTFDGKEKSLLRAAASDILPQSVIERTKVPYPSTQDPRYAQALRTQCQELLLNPNHQVFDVVDADLLRVSAKSDDVQIDQASRRELERVLDLAVWFDTHKPTLSFG